MRYMWNPWHGCKKISEGCKNCYVFYLDSKRGLDSGTVSKNTANFNYPLKKDRQGNYKIPSKVQVATCFTSDFLIEEADEWRAEAWEMIRSRSDVEFLIPTKRIERFLSCLPDGWGDGWENVNVAVSVENQAAADSRVPILLSAPIKKRSILMSPLLEADDLERYILGGSIGMVSVGGESYEFARECNFDWVKSIKAQCDRFGVSFDFHQTGTNFVYNGRRYIIPHKMEYSQAKKAFCR